MIWKNWKTEFMQFMVVLHTIQIQRESSLWVPRDPSFHIGLEWTSVCCFFGVFGIELKFLCCLLENKEVHEPALIVAFDLTSTVNEF